MKKCLPFLLLLFVPSIVFTQASTVRINEFLASNTMTNTDSSGSYDDWFELYNGGTTSIDLTGWYFTDDPLDMTRYQVPAGFGTNLAAGAFLLIWCDDDSAQGPLHANFKLSASGEFIGISSPDLTVIDSVTFGPQTSDVSFGRTPDGGSTWVTFSAPTPAATNLPVSVLPAQNTLSALRAYPNPVTTGQVFFSEPVTGTLCDLTGRCILHLDQQLTADLTQLPAGVYSIHTAGGQGMRIVVGQ